VAPEAPPPPRAARREPTRRRPRPAGTAPPHREPAIDPELRRLDRLAGVGLLAAEVAHEVRNALTAVKTFLHLQGEAGSAGCTDPEDGDGLLGVAREEVGRIERLLGALVAQASGAASPAPIPAPSVAGASNVVAAAGGVVQLVARRAVSAGVQLEVATEPGLPDVALAPDALRQVLLNLVLNALDATPRGGEVRIAARALGRAIEIAVDDCGPGIPPALRRRVLEPFVTTHGERPGGLGLTIVQRLVEEAGGTLVLGDRPEGGARVRLRLPVA
jgi:signal transduction histidine kinase